MSLEQRLRGHFEASLEAKQATLATMLPALLRATELMVAVLRAGNKVLVCGNGGSAADAQHFSAEFTGRYERERPGLPAIALTVDTSALTAIANDYAYDLVFSKQVQALGRPGDLLMAISTSGNSGNSASPRGFIRCAMSVSAFHKNLKYGQAFKILNRSPATPAPPHLREPL